MSRTHYVLVAAPWALLAVYGALALLTEPDPRGYGTHEQLGFGACLFRDWLGGPCPTCGVTTSASHLARGDLLEAWRAQPLGVLLAVAAIAGLPAMIALHRRGIDVGQWLLRYGAGAWAAAVVIVTTCWLL